MCYAHVMGNVQRKYKFDNSAENKENMKADLRVLHFSGDERTFDMGTELFVQKWQQNEPEVTRLLNGSFFKKKNKNWYVDCCPRSPKDNNTLDRCNGTTCRHLY